MATAKKTGLDRPVKIKGTEEKPTGRPSSYTDAISEEICERIALGEPVRQIALLEHMPEERTIYRWLLKHETFRQQYSRAKEAQADRFNEELLEIADDSSNDWIERENERTGRTTVMLNDEAVQRSKLRVAARQWLMGKHKPKKYGDKSEVSVEHSGNIDSRVTLTEEKRSEIMERRKAAIAGAN